MAALDVPHQSTAAETADLPKALDPRYGVLGVGAQGQRCYAGRSDMTTRLKIVAALVLSLVLMPVTGVSQEAGFISLFDGKSLAGWTLLGKEGEGYLVADGVLVCPRGGGGNLFTAKQYSDFVLRFEFKLLEGSNNGLAIRSPLKTGSVAYEGMELQIIDDNAERYKDIQPWQKHGSLYHVFPATTGHLKKPGEWNRQEVTVQGRFVKVVLNGHTILNADLDSVRDPEVLAKHPGLKRASGHIGFLGHDEPIEFRNIRIREL